MARPSSDIDPKAEDVAVKRRRRRNRSKAEPADDLQAKKAGMRSRALKRAHTPAVMFEPNAEGAWAIEAPHSDTELWQLQIADAFATRSQSVMVVFVSQLERLCSKSWDEDAQSWKPNETELNAILAMVADAQPKTTAEAALVAQSVAVHLVTMRLAKQALNNGGMVMEREAALMGKLARTYTQQMETLQGMRGKARTSRQTIKVSKELHQHVHYHRGDKGNEGQPHATDRTGDPEECPALPGPQEEGRTLPLTRRKGKASV